MLCHPLGVQLDSHATYPCTSQSKLWPSWNVVKRYAKFRLRQMLLLRHRFAMLPDSRQTYHCATQASSQLCELCCLAPIKCWRNKTQTLGLGEVYIVNSGSGDCWQNIKEALGFCEVEHLRLRCLHMLRHQSSAPLTGIQHTPMQHKANALHMIWNNCWGILCCLLLSWGSVGPQGALGADATALLPVDWLSKF